MSGFKYPIEINTSKIVPILESHDRQLKRIAGSNFIGFEPKTLKDSWKFRKESITLFRKFSSLKRPFEIRTKKSIMAMMRRSVHFSFMSITIRKAKPTPLTIVMDATIWSGKLAKG